MTTQNERIITLLRKPYPRWHCGTSFGRDYHSLATRICHLNKAGWDILSRRSTKHFHASGRAQQEYRLNSLA
ncbi:MAG: hypothetical protein KOO60_10850 [Gemmatimonadales bacterium]|nr:hypothetical protein [Gemmatimonadales bacterium]